MNLIFNGNRLQFKSLALNYYKSQYIIYGYLYNWYVVNDIANTDNENWRIPSDNDFNSLSKFIDPDGTDSSNTAGIALKSKREVPDKHPRWDNGSGLDTYNFNGLPASFRFSSGGFSNTLGTYTGWWTTSEHPDLPGDETAAGAYYLRNDWDYLRRWGATKRGGWSLKVVRDLIGNESLLSDGEYTSDYIGNDGRIYKTVKINNLVWTTDNLIETKYDNGSDIPEILDNTIWANDINGARCSYQHDESTWAWDLR